MFSSYSVAGVFHGVDLTVHDDFGSKRQNGCICRNRVGRTGYRAGGGLLHIAGADAGRVSVAPDAAALRAAAVGCHLVRSKAF